MGEAGKQKATFFCYIIVGELEGDFRLFLGFPLSLLCSLHARRSYRDYNKFTLYCIIHVSFSPNTSFLFVSFSHLKSVQSSVQYSTSRLNTMAIFGCVTTIIT